MNIHPDAEALPSEGSWLMLFLWDGLVFSHRVLLQCFNVFLRMLPAEMNTPLLLLSDQCLRRMVVSSGTKAMMCQPLIFSTEALITPWVSHPIISGLLLLWRKVWDLPFVPLTLLYVLAIIHSDSHSFTHCVQDRFWVSWRKFDENAFHIIFLIPEKKKKEKNVELDDAVHRVAMNDMFLETSPPCYINSLNCPPLGIWPKSKTCS